MSELDQQPTESTDAPQDLWFLPTVIVLLLAAVAGIGCLVARSNANDSAHLIASTTPALTAPGATPAVSLPAAPKGVTIETIAPPNQLRIHTPPVDYFSRPLPALGSPSILIDKSALVLSVFDDGTLVKQYRCIIGSNAGDKVKEGDMKTPEGTFYVCVKNPNSKYTRSLGLSYPDTEDAQRGLRAGWITRPQHDQIVNAIASRRQPLWYTPLGGEIMIHGWRADKRGRVRSGTLGCVAINDECILELFPKISAGTKVTIRP
ncbi:MAG: L,D-transpeptidase [Phycisphaerales bacterium]|jgi:hypothetical protein|nr:L,D-transpeptidase [Phycisphaerales bacterium]